MKPMTYKVEVDNNGTQRWYVDGRLSRLSRLDGPAVVWNDGTKAWWVDGKRHRLDGPAYEGSDGFKEWWVDGRLSRLDGPAVECNDGRKQWWVDGKQLSEKEFQKYVNNLKNPASCAGKVVQIEGRKYKLIEV